LLVAFPFLPARAAQAGAALARAKTTANATPPR
jgi:hypothetical protein